MMNAKELIELLKSDSIKYDFVVYRHSICWYLYKHGVPVNIISKVLHSKRRQIYRRMYTCRDLLDVRNNKMVDAYNEISCHEISVSPISEKSGICTINKGYNLLIDNEIY